MNYIFLKNIVETIIQNFTCPECQSPTNEQTLQVTGIGSQWLDIQIQCHVCQSKSMLHAEVNTMAAQMLQNEHGRKFFEDFIKQWGAITADLHQNPRVNVSDTIKDEDIVKVHKDLQKARTIEDLMKDDEV
jgi:uncharacterized protein YchJ